MCRLWGGTTPVTLSAKSSRLVASAGIPSVPDAGVPQLDRDRGKYGGARVPDPTHGQQPMGMPKKVARVCAAGKAAFELGSTAIVGSPFGHSRQKNRREVG